MARIFLSYGHDSHVSLARRLKADLEAHGHEVWFDETGLRAGRDWEQALEEALNWADRVPGQGRFLLLMTPYSVRRPDGYCLNELAFALERAVTVVPVMVVWCNRPLSLIRIQYLDMRDCVPLDTHAAEYQSKFLQLAHALEEGRLEVEVAQASWQRLLPLLAFDRNIADHLAGFTGRQWVFDRITAWMTQARAPQIFLLTGPPGVGKTAIAAYLCHHRPGIAAFHLCVHGDTDNADPRKCVMSIAHQLGLQIPAYANWFAKLDMKRLTETANARTLFDRLIAAPPEELPHPGARYAILIDALDEATTADGNELACFLAETFVNAPEWLRLIITCRPDPEVMHPLQSLTPFVLDTAQPENLDDVRACLVRELQNYAGPEGVPEAAIATILARSEGLFLYIRCIRAELQAGNLSLDRPEQFPQGLGGYFARFFLRRFPDKQDFKTRIEPDLSVLAVAAEPMEVAFLAGLLGWDDHRRKDFCEALGALFPVKAGRIAPFHKSVLDWLRGDSAGPHFVSASAGRERLAELCWRQYEAQPDALPPYVLHHLPRHLREVDRFEELTRLLMDVRFLQARCDRQRIPETVADLADAVESLLCLRPGRLKAGRPGDRDGLIRQLLTYGFEDLPDAECRQQLQDGWVDAAAEVLAEAKDRGQALSLVQDLYQKAARTPDGPPTWRLPLRAAGLMRDYALLVDALGQGKGSPVAAQAEDELFLAASADLAAGHAEPLDRLFELFAANCTGLVRLFRNRKRVKSIALTCMRLFMAAPREPEVRRRLGSFTLQVLDSLPRLDGLLFRWLLLPLTARILYPVIRLKWDETARQSSVPQSLERCCTIRPEEAPLIRELAELQFSQYQEPVSDGLFDRATGLMRRAGRVRPGDANWQLRRGFYGGLSYRLAKTFPERFVRDFVESEFLDRAGQGLDLSLEEQERRDGMMDMTFRSRRYLALEGDAAGIVDLHERLVRYLIEHRTPLFCQYYNMVGRPSHTLAVLSLCEARLGVPGQPMPRTQRLLREIRAGQFPAAVSQCTRLEILGKCFYDLLFVGGLFPEAVLTTIVDLVHLPALCDGRSDGGDGAADPVSAAALLQVSVNAADEDIAVLLRRAVGRLALLAEAMNRLHPRLLGRVFRAPGFDPRRGAQRLRQWLDYSNAADPEAAGGQLTLSRLVQKLGDQDQVGLFMNVMIVTSPELCALLQEVFEDWLGYCTRNLGDREALSPAQVRHFFTKVVGKVFRLLYDSLKSSQAIG